MAEQNRPFLSDLQTIRARAHIERGAVTASYSADPQTVVRLLNEALATGMLEDIEMVFTPRKPNGH